jgi:hypothetical protein
MAAYNKIAGFVEHLAEKVHNLGSDSIKVALSNTAPGSESTPPTGATTTAILANVTQITYTNLSSRTITISSSAQAAGTYSLVATDLVLTSTGGTTGPFRYIYVYNDTATNDELIAYFDYGSAVTLADGETFTLDFGSSLFTLV